MLGIGKESANYPKRGYLRRLSESSRCFVLKTHTARSKYSPNTPKRLNTISKKNLKSKKEKKY